MSFTILITIKELGRQMKKKHLVKSREDCKFKIKEFIWFLTTLRYSGILIKHMLSSGDPQRYRTSMRNHGDALKHGGVW